ncbi:manganese catalase family protein [Fictibacillus barbaricus]|uniref:Mn-containing catalase n=1 Tax=Fictibacillus barbaricus TaxID=182136 RepID=A0ABU1TUZ8_9BACL|nr:Mn-containing catalase [Fictibacillus barbaricus]
MGIFIEQYEAVKHTNPHHFIMGAQSSLPADAGGNPWDRSWVYNHGNLITDLLNNVILESTGVLHKSRIYEMSSNKTFREILGFLIVRDNLHQNAFLQKLSKHLALNGANFSLCLTMI